jgi:hypothetical protein
MKNVTNPDAKIFAFEENQAAVAYVKSEGYGSSYEAISKKMVFIAGANVSATISEEEAVAALKAGREWGLAERIEPDLSRFKTTTQYLAEDL